MSATRSSSTRGGHEEASGRVVSRRSVHEPTKRETHHQKAPETPSIAFQGYRVAHRRAAVAVERVQMCAMASRRAVRSPIVPMAAGRAGARGADEPARARRWRWFVPRWRRRGSWRTRARPPSRGEAAGQTGGVGAPSPRWGRDQRADAASEARRGVSTSGPPATPSPRETAMSRRRRFLRVTRRSACRSSWRGAGCAADARPRSSSAEAWSPWKVRWRSRATRRCRTRA